MCNFAIENMRRMSPVDNTPLQKNAMNHHGVEEVLFCTFSSKNATFRNYRNDYTQSISKNFSRFSFTGKEKDEETGYGYFGARYMDHELMTMWLSVDPMADKYPNISPYAYCAWNPIRLTDPNGCDIDTASVPAKIWNMVNPQHDSYNAEFAEVFNQLAADHSAIFSFNEWSEPEIKGNVIIRGKTSLIESTEGHPDKISIGFLWGEEGVPVAPERFMFEEAYHAKQFLDGEWGYGYSKGEWGLMGFDLYDEEDAHRWADRVSGSPNSWTQEAIDYYKFDRGLPDSRRNVTEHYMNHDGIKRTHPPKYDQNGIYKTDIRTMRKPKN